MRTQVRNSGCRPTVGASALVALWNPPLSETSKCIEKYERTMIRVSSWRSLGWSTAISGRPFQDRLRGVSIVNQAKVACTRGEGGRGPEQSQLGETGPDLTYFVLSVCAWCMLTKHDVGAIATRSRFPPPVLISERGEELFPIPPCLAGSLERVR
ncbi:hypothetical protein AG1IA_09217 [Rhizoctonia solani AG-1 IA]|uniref:Uncharacterized protein n=1 Tax=Thanatephorus cucumeris (strain AG1-IA) TaxID=983506 RepID=L8WIW7_THACA|nr:hypothetical protein AG1IA_09217 [Rhizoctonia solani AG-1 IA]